jgi:hypothetical protein
METFQQTDLDDLKTAKSLLENPGIAAKISHWFGKPIEIGFELLPRHWSRKIGEVTQTALSKAMNTAILTMNHRPYKKASNRWHKAAVAATGGVGGFFGLPAMAIELPVSTTIMLRSIADIARSEGENIHEIEARLACMEVFALGGASKRDDASESGYFATRAALARSITEAAEYLTGKGLADKNAPALIRLIVKIAERFSIQVSEKIAAQAVPAIGAAGGAAINTLFIDHFQDMARGHFIIRRLEKKYGQDIVAATYHLVI